MKQRDDPAIDRIRRARHQISEDHHHDPKRLVEHYIELQKKYRERLLEGSDERIDPVKA